MSDALYSHVLRERWMTSIASLHQITVFRFAKSRALQVSDLMIDLQWEIVRLEQSLTTRWPASRMLEFWQKIEKLLKILDVGYMNILQRLSNSEWQWWRGEDTARRHELRDKKESIIKILAVFEWIFLLVQSAFESSFKECRPWFLDFGRRPLNPMCPQRRRSWHSSTDETITPVSDWISVDVAILRWVQYLEEQLESSMSIIPLQYNKSVIFEHYVFQVQRAVEEEISDWAEDGIKWPYPDYHLKLSEIDILDSKFIRRHSPRDNVPCWEEDQELRALLNELGC